jgi:hypothetical protein
VHFLREAAPVCVPGLPVTIFPCPLKQRRSMDDPTVWIERHPPNGDKATIRLGLAHGSLKIMPLPEDDHLIAPDAADRLGLDYLALGHWHKRLTHAYAAGCTRTAYSGVHEPMRFPGMSAGVATGWSSYSADGDAERFYDDGVGQALLVTIDRPGASPQIEPIETGRLRWLSHERDLTAHSLGSVISEYSRQESPERTMLRLSLTGVIEPRDQFRMGELEKIVLNRYHAGSSLDTQGVLVEPSPEQLAEVVGEGVLKRVLERLQQDLQSPDVAMQRVTRHALKLLYQIAWEEQPK